MHSGIPFNEYLSLKPSDLKKERYRHVLLLLYWPVYLLVFLMIERFTGGAYTPIRCGLDDAIPFCEWFIVPYFLWFPYLVGMLLYTLLEDTESFRRLMRYFIVTFTAAVILYRLFPNCQELRPTSFPRDNLMTGIVAFLYRLDTNTNVCPSEHVIGSAGVIFAAFSSPKLKKHRAWILALGILICASTVFVKQHSLWDHAAAIPVCLAGWLLCFRAREGQNAAAGSY